MRIKFFSKGRDEGRLNFAFHIQRRKLITLASLQTKGKNIYSIELSRVLDIFLRSRGGFDAFIFLNIIEKEKEKNENNYLR